MARIRSSKPEWWRKPKWCALPRDVRFTYKGIWEVMCDDYGRFLADTRLIKGDVWPFDDDITTKKLEQWLQQLAAITVTIDDGTRSPAVVLYNAEGARYGFLPGFVKHQKISHKTDSKFPPPPSEFPEPFPNDSGIPQKNSPTSGSGAERDVELDRDLEAERSADLVDADPIIRAEDRQPASAPLVELPADATRLVEQLYSLATSKRQLDVTRQLYDSIDPRLKGARLRPGVFVKARSLEHLAQCCRAVMADPPRNIDAAIVIVLEKLQDPPKGPTPSEVHKADTDAFVAEQGAYDRAAKAAGVTWAKANPELYEPIRIAADREFPDAGNTFMRMARESALTQRCAKAAGFVDFETWRAERARRIA